MGQASRRGTLEQRVIQAQLAVAHEEALDIHKALKLKEQEMQGWKTMTWWQIELSMERYERAAKRKHKNDMAMAQIFGMLAGTIYGRHLR